jgi:hypothetical protein
MPFDEALLHAAASRGLGVETDHGAAHLAKATDLLEGQGARAELEVVRGTHAFVRATPIAR